MVNIYYFLIYLIKLFINQNMDHYIYNYRDNDLFIFNLYALFRFHFNQLYFDFNSFLERKSI